MASVQTTSIFLDGCIIEKNFFLFSSRMDALHPDDYDHGLVVWYLNGKWMYQSRDWQVSSVCVMRTANAEPKRAYVALEEGSGVVGIYRPGAPKTDDELLPGAEDGHGIPSLMDIAQIGSSLYVCGYGGKILRRAGEKWENFDAGLKALGLGDYLKQGMTLDAALEADNITQRDMRAIDGFSEQAIFCVGRVGLIFWHDGKIWSQLSSPTNVDLNCVHCAEDGFVYAGGNPGVLLQGNEHGFHVLHIGVNDDFYALTWFNGHLYVGGLKGLYRLERNGLQYVNTMQGAFSCVALDARDGQLLVVTDRWLSVFDGTNWKRIDDPDNI